MTQSNPDPAYNRYHKPEEKEELVIRCHNCLIPVSESYIGKAGLQICSRCLEIEISERITRT